MAYGRVGIDLHQAVQRERVPDAVLLLPVQRRAPAVGLHRVPAQRQPQLGAAIAIVGNEGQKVAVRDRVRSEFESRDKSAVARSFVVECKAVSGVAEFVNAFLVPDPAAPARIDGGQRPRLAIDRVQRVLRKQMLEIGEDQFLVLLFVIGVRVRPPPPRPDPGSRCRNSCICPSTCSRYARTSGRPGREIRPRSARGCLSPTAL